jgi:membrane protease YdiL (CAAX protease family)
MVQIRLPSAYPNCMRALLWFLGLIIAALAAMALCAYPAWAWLNPYFGFPFHRVADRIGMLALAIGFVLVARRLGLADRASLGYGIPRRRFLREALTGFAIGAPAMALIVVVMALLSLRSWRSDVTLDAAKLASLAGQGLLRGIAVALIEETFLRGAMFSAVARESGTRLAIVATALLYAATHFVGQYHVPAQQLAFRSGFDQLAGSFAAFAHPLHLADAFLCLTAVGLVLGAVRALTGNIAACIGLHAAWVWVITFVRETSVPDPAQPLAFLLSQFDGVVGWLVLVWTLLVGVVVCRFYAARAPAP